MLKKCALGQAPKQPYLITVCKTQTTLIRFLHTQFRGVWLYVLLIESRRHQQVNQKVEKEPAAAIQKQQKLVHSEKYLAIALRSVFLWFIFEAFQIFLYPGSVLDANRKHACGANAYLHDIYGCVQ